MKPGGQQRETSKQPKTGQGGSVQCTWTLSSAGSEYSVQTVCEQKLQMPGSQPGLEGDVCFLHRKCLTVELGLDF